MKYSKQCPAHPSISPISWPLFGASSIWGKVYLYLLSIRMSQWNQFLLRGEKKTGRRDIPFNKPEDGKRTQPAKNRTRQWELRPKKGGEFDKWWKEIELRGATLADRGIWAHLLTVTTHPALVSFLLRLKCFEQLCRLTLLASWNDSSLVPRLTTLPPSQQCLSLLSQCTLCTCDLTLILFCLIWLPVVYPHL